jgi:hypothetical protein
MGRYTATLSFDARGGSPPHGTDVFAGLPLPEHATLRSRSCDGGRLTLVIDFRSSRPAAVCRRAVDAVRATWRQATGADVGEPISVRVRPLRPPQPVPGGASRRREYAWRPDGTGDGRLELVDAGTDPITPPSGLPTLEDADQGALSSEPRKPPRRTRGLGPLRITLPQLPRRRQD